MLSIPLRPVDAVAVTTLMDNSCDALLPAAEAPAVLVPAHCTSWAAQHALAAGLPDAFRPNAVGSRFAL